MKRSLQEPSLLLELTPPAFTEKTAYTTAQLFSVIHRLGRDKTFLEKLLGRKTRFSFEIVSSRSQGIRYVIRITPKEINSVKRDLLSYLPGVQVKTVNEYLPENIEKQDSFHTRVIEFTQEKPFAYPLQKQNMLEEHDPVAYITGQMTKLSSGELISFQIVLSPTQTGEARIIKQKIFRGEDVLAYVNTLNKVSLAKGLSILTKSVTGLLGIIGWAVRTAVNDAVDPYKARSQMQTQFQMQSLVTNQLKPARMITSFEQQAIQSIEQKIDQPLFETRIRLLMIMKDKNDLQERVKGFTSSLDVFSATEHQSLRRKRNLINNMFGQYLFLNFQKRLLSFVFNSSPDLLSASEISDIYHFPFTNVTQTENIVKIHSKELPAPISLKKDPQEFDVVFAKNSYGGTETLIGLTKEQRIRHQYIIGATGSGKSTMLLSMIEQDIKNGKGICVIDPHGDLAEAVRNLVPEERIKDFIYINPDDLSYPIGINLLELTPGLDEDDALREKQFIMESVVSMFRKIFSDDMSGAGGGQAHRIEYILRNTILTAFTIPNATIFTIYDLLDDPEFRNKTIARIQNERLKKFWKYEFGKAGDYQRVKMVSGVTARIGRFLFSPSAQRMLEQEKSTINFDEILDSGKIVVCNLSRGRIGEDTAEVLGIMILNKIQLAALRRSRVEEKTRRPFYLYVDEFQHFATQSFIKMLSEARKYALNLIIAEQSTSQLSDRAMVFNILANVGTVVCFKSANPEDEKIMLPQFSPYVKETEIMNLPVFRFYMKISAISPEEPFS
ncbi:MAG: type IV secretion system DNA-binding domain-containing protein, partial [Candidatus Levybacteria bacterium]|nr:type IV secretion system DNA-binding domain-containing protein [Candidatus Levybacteria bacterium]